MEASKTIRAKVWDYVIEIKATLKDGKKWKIFSCVWDVYDWFVANSRYICWWQCSDEIRQIVKNMQDNKLWLWLLDMRDKYHLNDMHAWTPKQEKFLKELHKDWSRYDYPKDCEELEKAWILVCNWYKYWTSWLFRKIPAKDLNKIQNFIFI